MKTPFEYPAALSEPEKRAAPNEQADEEETGGHEEPIPAAEHPVTLAERILAAGPGEAVALAQQEGLPLIPISTSSQEKFLGIAIMRKLTDPDDPELKDMRRYWESLDECAFVPGKYTGLIRGIPAGAISLPKPYQDELAQARVDLAALNKDVQEYIRLVARVEAEYWSELNKHKKPKGILGVFSGKPAKLDEVRKRMDPEIVRRYDLAARFPLGLSAGIKMRDRGILLEFLAYKSAVLPVTDERVVQLRSELQRVVNAFRDLIERSIADFRSSPNASTPYR